MSLYTGNQGNWRATPLKQPDLPEPISGQLSDAAGYQAGNGLIHAVDVALTLRQPLLLTGEPGTGKTLLAYNVAKELGWGEPIKIEVKSTTTSSDLFYHYDHMSDYRDSRKDSRKHVSQYLTFCGLGLALVKANPADSAAAALLKDDDRRDRRGNEMLFGTHSVVLIDEVDKAPRDFPNDILNELEHGYFHIPEAQNLKVSAPEHMMPFVIITSNSEKHLPDAFLRRCAYYDIPFPDAGELQKILGKRIKDPSAKLVEGTEPLCRDAIELFQLLRAEHNELRKNPSTGEFLAWVNLLLARGASMDKPLKTAVKTIGNERFIELTRNVLIKNREDRDTANGVLKSWLEIGEG